MVDASHDAKHRVHCVGQADRNNPGCLLVLELLRRDQPGQRQVGVFILVTVRLPPIGIVHGHDAQHVAFLEREPEVPARQVRVVQRLVVEKRAHVFL